MGTPEPESVIETRVLRRVSKSRQRQVEAVAAAARRAVRHPTKRAKVTGLVLTSVLSKAVFGLGALLGFGVIVFGLAGLGLSFSDPRYKNDVGVGVGIVLLGNALLGTCLVMLIKPHHTMTPIATGGSAPRGIGGFAMALGAGGMAIPDLGLLGWIVILLMFINTVIALGHPGSGGSYVIPWGTIAVIVRRVLQGNWPAAIIIAAVWVVAVLILQAAAYFGW